MEYGINLDSVMPLRAKPDHRSEMVSQLLLGESFVCEEYMDGFCKISAGVDKYTGWVDEKNITKISQDEYISHEQQPAYCVILPLVEAFDLVNKCIIRIPGGSRLPNCDNIGRFGLHGHKFQVHRDFILSESEIIRDGLLLTAAEFMNAPYLWGGKTVMGIDCSGFTQVVFGLHGVKLPRDSKDQASVGESVDFLNAKPGDLLFFQNKDGDVIHVGIFLEKQRIIHASGRVRIDHLDEKGIYSEEYQKYTHKLHSVRRIR